jgi:hypothetical protein
MILADTSVWADHLRMADVRLAELLAEGQVLMHPFVLGEIALCYIRKRGAVFEELHELPSMHVADPEEVLHLIEARNLVGAGIGYVDAHLLAATITTRGCQLWTRDKRLHEAAARLDVAARMDH